MPDTHQRTLIKTISWRALATCTTIALVYGFTRELTLAAGIGGLELILKLALYYAHERVWNTLSWGKQSAL
jgi:uncharacterized membrane protein